MVGMGRRGKIGILRFLAIVAGHHRRRQARNRENPIFTNPVRSNNTRPPTVTATVAIAYRGPHVLPAGLTRPFGPRGTPDGAKKWCLVVISVSNDMTARSSASATGPKRSATATTTFRDFRRAHVPHGGGAPPYGSCPYPIRTGVAGKGGTGAVCGREVALSARADGRAEAVEREKNRRQRHGHLAQRARGVPPSALVDVAGWPPLLDVDGVPRRARCRRPVPLILVGLPFCTPTCAHSVECKGISNKQRC